LPEFFWPYLPAAQEPLVREIFVPFEDLNIILGKRQTSVFSSAARNTTS